MDRFRVCLERMLGHEGFYANHPADPGGATMRGVTQSTYDQWRRRKRLPLRSVRDIEQAEIEAIYRGSYWRPVRADDLPPGVDYAVFDAAVNSGPRRAIQWLQRAVGTNADGIVGPKTLAVVNATPPRAIVSDVCALRLSFMRGLRTWEVFGRGWQRRVEEVEADALSDAMSAPVTPEPQSPVPDTTPARMGFWRRLWRFLFAS